MINFKAVLIFFLLSTGIAVSVFSQSEDIITSIRITGLRRTAPRVAEEPLRQFIGQEAAALDINQVVAVIIDQGILEPISIVIEDAADEPGKILVVEVYEKWSIIPIPVFFGDSGGLSGGAYIIDSNAFGLNHQLAVGGIFGSGSWLAMGMYGVPSRGPGNFGWNINVSFSEGVNRKSDERNNTLLRFNAFSFSANFTMQYRISNALTTAFNVSYSNIMLRNTENPIREPISGAHYIQFRPELSVRRTGWDGYFLSVEGVSIRYGLIYDLDSSIHNSFTLSGIYEKSFYPGFRTSIRAGGSFRPDVPVFLENSSRVSAVNILPGSFSAFHYAGLSLGLEHYIFRFSLGTISLIGAGQMVFSNGPILENRFDYGIMASLFFYMSRIAFPAMSLGISYNIPANFFQIIIGMGMSF